MYLASTVDDALYLLYEFLIAFLSVVFFGMLMIDVAPYLKKTRENESHSRFNPKALVIVPCRGIDIGLEDNLRSIMGQGYGSYKAIAVVDSSSDPSVAHIRKVGMKFITSSVGKSGRASGKVRAIITALMTFRDYQAYVIADSDIRVRSNWLSELIKPLGSSKIGISTTFPKFVPKAGFWSKVKFVWGFVGEGLMENKGTRFGWGGSLAFRKDLLNKNTMRLLRNSRYSVSDDISLTKAAKSMGLEIAYVRQAQPVVNSADSFGQFAEWSTRQSALTILGYSRNLYYGIAFYTAEILLFVSAFVMSYLITPLFLLFLVHFVKSEIKTARRAGKPDFTIALIVALMPFIYLSNLIAASGTSQITWRGRLYKI
jgi:cellulose synthase/poly-beta-1,6-N-acetylglucosamine synthase-like glycosyltransferase